MLRQCAAYSPQPPQLRFLLAWAFADLEGDSERHTAFALLRAILARRLALPEVYDLMAKVQELVVRPQAAQVRQLAAAALLQFLLDYPLGEKRLRGHLHFLLANLGYEHEAGRLAAVGMVATLVDKFPEEVVSEWAETVSARVQLILAHCTFVSRVV
jgi:U3 small nucleolar RNA-associated protein 20